MAKVYERWMKVLQIIRRDNGDNENVDGYRGKNNLLTPFLVTPAAATVASADEDDDNEDDNDSVDSDVEGESESPSGQQEALIDNNDEEDADDTWPEPLIQPGFDNPIDDDADTVLGMVQL